MIESWLTIASALVVALVCIAGVFSDFKDTTAQRIALAVGCVASTGVAWQVWKGETLPGAVDLMLWALAVHCFEAARKFWRSKNGAP